MNMEKAPPHSWDIEEEAEEDEEECVDDTTRGWVPSKSMETAKRSSAAPSSRPIYAVKRRKENLNYIGEVKEAHQCHDWGEAEEFKGDVDYFMDSIRSLKSNDLKCLSMMRLAKKCLSGSFRQFLRARNCVTELLQRAGEFCEDPAMAVCTACVLYVLSRDRLSLSVEKPSLELVFALLRTPTPGSPDPTYAKYKRQVWQLLTEWRTQVMTASPDFQFDLNEDNVSPSFLATEALVYISGRTVDEWFKRESLKLDGLQLVVRFLVTSIDQLPGNLSSLTANDLNNLKLIQRYLRILENLTYLCPQNQMYLISHRESIVLTYCENLMSFIFKAIPVTFPKVQSTGCTGRAPKAKAKEEGPAERLLLGNLVALVRLLCNLSHESELCCNILGRVEGFLADSVSLITWLGPAHIPVQHLFDLLFLMLGLLINLVEHCNSNRRCLLNLRVPQTLDGLESSDVPLLEALTKVFLFHEKSARQVDEEVSQDMEEAATSMGGSGPEPGPLKPGELEETLRSAMNKAGKHMEDTIMASYIALLVGFMFLQNESSVDSVRDMLPDRSFKCMLEPLRTLSDFAQLANMTTSTGQKSISRVIELLEDLDVK